MMQSERPREVYLAACARIAQSFAQLGFRYAKTKPRLVRREGDLSCEIRFQFHRRNYTVRPDMRDASVEALARYGKKSGIAITPELEEEMLLGHIGMNCIASVFSRQLGAWRRAEEFPLRIDDYVAGDELGRLRRPPLPATFNLAPWMTREQSIVEATALVHEVALPFFNLFRNPREVVRQLLETEMPGFKEALTFDYVLCFGSRPLAVGLLRRWLESDTDLRIRFKELLPRFQTEESRELTAWQRDQGMPGGGHKERAGRLAQIAAAYQLNLS
jgi:hypothetical protein